MVKPASVPVLPQPWGKEISIAQLVRNSQKAYFTGASENAMDTLSRYKSYIEEILHQYASRKPVNRPKLEYQLIIDEERLQFILLAVGWHNNDFIHNWIFHLQLKGDKIWVYEDMTDPGIKVFLMEKGVPSSDIILGFLPEYELESIPPVTAG